MLSLRRIEVENFVCFDDVIIEPASDPMRSLTVIRAENGNGKTTLLRAIRWGMYGEKGLPGISTRYSVHPPWWDPAGADIKTRVSIEFETDGSSRNYTASGSVPQLYRLDRTVRTIGKPTANEDEPDFRRVDERPTLMVRDPSGRWGAHEKHPDTVIEELLPWDLRDFFIMDADEAADFVGGSDEHRTVSRHEYREKTTHAINSLLGLDVFERAKNRVAKIAKGLARQATKAIGDHNLDELQEQLDRAEADKQETEATLQRAGDLEADLADRREGLQSELEREIGRLGAYEALSEQLRQNRKQQELSNRNRDSYLATLARDLESLDLLAALSSVAISTVHGYLEPLYEEGRIPLAHLPFVRGLLDAGRCVCGQDLSAGEARHRAEARVAETEQEEARADYLYHLYDAALRLDRIAAASTWNKTRTRHAADLADCDRRLSGLKAEQKALEQTLDQIDEVKIQTLRDQIAAVEQQIDNAKFNIGKSQDQLQNLESTVTSLNRTLEQRKRNQRAAADYLAAEDMAGVVVETLGHAYSRIQDEQVRDLSDKMNALFHQMAADVSDTDFTATQRSRASLRMIAEVGVRHVGDRRGLYEIYALNSRGRAMPPVEINGASRRVLALSFVLALCDESNTRAPLIADSLLNVMSGAVRRNTLRVTARHSRQPILLLNNADLEASSETATVAEFAGATYTLTAQWVGAGGGDVVNRVAERQVALMCSCGPREYCDICERSGQASAPGWVRQYD